MSQVPKHVEANHNYCLSNYVSEHCGVTFN